MGLTQKTVSSFERGFGLFKINDTEEFQEESRGVYTKVGTQASLEKCVREWLWFELKPGSKIAIAGQSSTL